jgi:putative tryptophan/tyrosine transport system substrate-binding protein
MSHMRRREFITLLGGAAVAWPLAARGQQPERMRRIGVLLNLAADDPESQRRMTAFVQGLQQLGWTDGRNVRIDTRSGAADPDRIRRYAAELIALEPDVILAATGFVTGAVRQATRTVPIVFVQVIDPVGTGFVESLARPGGNATGFMQYEYGLSGKWLELLKEIAPHVTRAAVFREPTDPAQIGQFAAIQSMAPSLGMLVSPVNVHDAPEIERAVTAFAHSSNGGLIVPGSALATTHRDLLITLAAQHKLPAVYSNPIFVTGGGLISYGPDRIDQYRHAAGYVDRILKGEKPADLPVQAPTKYELVINLKTAKALGLDMPATVLARADEVIE